MKRLALALAVVALVACKKAEEAQPMADSAAAPAAAPMPGDTMKTMGDSAAADTTKKAM